MTIDLHNSPIEVQIVSSADACSHFIGPFFNMRRHENPEKNYRDLMQDNIRKAMKDWDRKIVLDFVKEKIEPRFKFLLEQC